MAATATGFLETIPWADAALVPPALNTPIERQIRKAIGFPMSSMPTLSWVPWVAEAQVRFGPASRSSIPMSLQNLIELVVSQDNACRYCYGITRSVLRINGMSDAMIRQLEADLHTAPLSDREQAALDYARRVSRAVPRIGPADMAQLRAAGYTDAEIVEITFLAAVATFLNRMATLLALQPDMLETLEGGALGWLFRPFLNQIMRRMRPTYPCPPVPAGTTTPVDALFAALEGVPGRDALRRCVVDAQASSITTPRQKALIMAVVATGLECHLCARGSRDVLRRDGFAEAEVDAMVGHLASARLDPLDLSLMRFARETIRFRPDVIHRRCTEFFREVSPAMAVEVVGLAGLANLLGRVSVLLPA